MNQEELYSFIKWVAKEVCRQDFEDYSASFSELCCRKLHYLGLVKKCGDKWVLNTKEVYQHEQ